MSKDLTFDIEFLDRVSEAHNQIELDNIHQLEGNKHYVLNLLKDSDSGVSQLLTLYGEAYAMKEARGGKQLSGKDLIELGLSSSDKEEAKGLRKMRDGLAKLYDAKGEGTYDKFVSWTENHSDFTYATIFDAIRACFRKDTEPKANPKPTDLKAFAVKVIESIQNRKFDNEEQFDAKEVEEIAMRIGVQVMSKKQKEALFSTAKSTFQGPSKLVKKAS